jgi:hypothetical protein
MKVKTKDLRKLFEILMKRTEFHLSEEVDLDCSFFWTIPFDKTQTSVPPELFMADLEDDIKYVSQLLECDDGVTELDFERFGNIIRAIGFSIEKSRK